MCWPELSGSTSHVFTVVQAKPASQTAGRSLFAGHTVQRIPGNVVAAGNEQAALTAAVVKGQPKGNSVRPELCQEAPIRAEHSHGKNAAHIDLALVVHHDRVGSAELTRFITFLAELSHKFSLRCKLEHGQVE